MTAPLIAPVIPSSARPSARGHRAAGGGRRLPVAAVQAPPAAPQDVLYGFGRIDMAARVADRAVISALGWRQGDRLTLTAKAGVVTARRDPAGLITMTAKPYIVIPAALRRRCVLRPGDRVLVAAVPADDMLAAYSLAVVDQTIRAHGSFLVNSDRSPVRNGPASRPTAPAQPRRSPGFNSHRHATDHWGTRRAQGLDMHQEPERITPDAGPPTRRPGRGRPRPGRTGSRQAPEPSPVSPQNDLRLPSPGRRASPP